uniref:PIN domain-containing protein n=1 Tax=mine drainage metagenome TaxID=410659 RepID=E6PD61_9ZZZZ
MIALDTNVIIDIEEGSPESAERALRAVERAGERGGLVICGIVYAELHARPQRAASDLDDTLRTARIAVDLQLTAEIWREAGHAYAAYARRRRAAGGDSPRRILADFVIGAHARAVGSLVTRDAAFYRRAFPKLRVVAVDEFEETSDRA